MSEHSVGLVPNSGPTSNVGVIKLSEQPTKDHRVNEDETLEAKNQQSEKATSTAAPANNQRKQPQRKQSVFSFNGFPDASLLLEQQQPLKSRDTPADQDAALSTIANVSTPPTVTDDCIARSATDALTAQSARVPQVRAIDKLGSTGSSRASSCDEPSLTSTSSSQAQQKASSGSNTSNTEKSLDSPLHRTVVSQEPSSSSSSLGSTSWCSEQANDQVKSIKAARAVLNEEEEDDENESTCSTSEQEDMRPIQDNNSEQLTPKSPPFESIASQLKQLNAAPDAQLLERHIDNIISQNEAIIDNSNFVSIRSYNSSQQQANKRLSISAAATSTEKSPSDTIIRLASVSGGSPRPVQQARSSKRWSTSGVPSSRTPMYGMTADREPIDTIYNHTYEDTSQANILKQLTERKRSYNAPIPPTVALNTPLTPYVPSLLPEFHRSLFSLHDSHQFQQQTKPLPNDKSSQPTTLDSTLQLTLSLNETKQLLKQKQQTHSSQLEDAIQNLSLKRREETLQQQQQTTRLQVDQRQPVDLNDMRTDSNINASSNNNNNKSLHNNHHHHQRSYSIAGQNLISADIAQLRSCEDQQFMAAALLLNERFQQSFVEQQISLENQALFHHQQQQMIEYQLEQFRLAAALKQHQLQLGTADGTTWSAKEEQTQLMNGLLYSTYNHTDLSILKRQLSLVPQAQIGSAGGPTLETTDNNASNLDCNRPRESLPFKKRKISQPDMRN